MPSFGPSLQGKKGRPIICHLNRDTLVWNSAESNGTSGPGVQMETVVSQGRDTPSLWSVSFLKGFFFFF